MSVRVQAGLLSPDSVRRIPAEVITEIAGGRLAVRLGDTLFPLACETFAPGCRGRLIWAEGGRWLHFQSEAELQHLTHEAEQLRRNEQAASDLKITLHRLNGYLQNSAFDSFPVAWTPARRVVLAGLTEQSHGDGTFKRSVVHLQLDRPLVVGRLRRQVGDLLCTPAPRFKLAKAAGATRALWTERELFSSALTCRTCLDIAAKLSATYVATIPSAASRRRTPI